MFAFASQSILWSSPCRMHELSVLSDFRDLCINFTFLLFFIFIFQHFLLPFIFPEVSQEITLRTLAEEMESNDKNFSSTGYEPNDYFLTQTYVEFNQESLTEQRFPEDVDYDDAAIGQMLFNAYRGQVDHSEGEGLSSGLSSSSMFQMERGNPLWTVTKVMIERSNPLLKVTKFTDETLKKNRLGLSWTDTGRKSSLNARRRLENTNSRLIVTEEVYKNWAKRSSRSKKNFIALKQKDAVDEINNFFMNSYRTGIFVMPLRKVSMKWKNWGDFRFPHSIRL